MSLTFKDVITKKQGVRKMRADIIHIIDDTYAHKDTISQSEFNKLIKILTRGTTLHGTFTRQIGKLFEIYIPSQEQLDLILDTTRQDWNNENVWSLYLSNNGYIFTEKQQKILLEKNCSEFIFNSLKLIKNDDNPVELLINVLSMANLSHITHNIEHINEFTSKHKNNISDDNIFDICCILSCKKKQLSVDLTSLLINGLNFKTHIVAKLFNHILDSNVYDTQMLICDLYNKFSDIIELSDGVFLQCVNYYNENDAYKLIMHRKNRDNLLMMLHDMLNKINNQNCFKIALNKIQYHESMHEDNNIYKNLIARINKHNVNYTTSTLINACDTGNLFLINECVKNKVNSDSHCFKCAMEHSYDVLVDHYLQSNEPTDEHLSFACKKGTYGIIQKILDTKLIPNTLCFINVLQNRHVYGYDYDKIMTSLVEHGGTLNKLILKHMIVENKIFTKLFDYGASRDDFFDICHYYCEINGYHKYISYNKPHRQLYKLIHDEYNHHVINEFKNIQDIEFDKYCYDLMLISTDDKLKTIVDDAIENKKYIPTNEAIAREKSVVRRQHFLGIYNFNTSFNSDPYK
jgi:hypothetical protein